MLYNLLSASYDWYGYNVYIVLQSSFDDFCIIKRNKYSQF